MTILSEKEKSHVENEVGEGRQRYLLQLIIELSYVSQHPRQNGK